MIASMTIPSGRLAQFQELVKLHDLRFCANPLECGDLAYVRVSTEHLPLEKANAGAFFADWERLVRPITEVTPPLWKRWLRKCKGRLLQLRPT
jgi:hypothetical protein